MASKRRRLRPIPIPILSITASAVSGPSYFIPVELKTEDCLLCVRGSTPPMKYPHAPAVWVPWVQPHQPGYNLGLIRSMQDVISFLYGLVLSFADSEIVKQLYDDIVSAVPPTTLVGTSLIADLT